MDGLPYVWGSFLRTNPKKQEEGPNWSTFSLEPQYTNVVISVSGEEWTLGLRYGPNSTDRCNIRCCMSRLMRWLSRRNQERIIKFIGLRMRALVVHFLLLFAY